jgi:hypothetical protein
LTSIVCSLHRHYIERATADDIDHEGDIDNPLLDGGHFVESLTQSTSQENLLEGSGGGGSYNSDRRRSGSRSSRDSRDRGSSVEGFTRPALHTMLSVKNINRPDPLESPATKKKKQEEDRESHSLDHIMSVFAQIRTPALSVIFTFLVTIGLFPSLTVFLESQDKCKSDNNRFTNDLYVPFFFLMFNLFDFIGRVTAGSFDHVFTADNIWIPAAARVVFFPLFLLCRISGSQLPVVFASDAFPIIFMMLFALSNGYVASSCMMLGGSIVPPKESSLAGTIMVFSLTFGLLCGAMASFPVVYISQGHL